MIAKGYQGKLPCYSVGEFSHEDRERFWALVKIQASGCWEWQGNLRVGYGKFAMSARKLSAHRVSFYLSTGIDPVGALITHDCDNPRCVNPAHLRLGNATSNAREAVERGRRTKKSGTNNGVSKLSPDQVQEIRRLHNQGWGYKRLAKRYEVARATIQLIIKGITWRHVP